MRKQINTEQHQPISAIGTCYTCHKAECWKPKQPTKNPHEGCAEWLPATPQPEIKAEPVLMDDGSLVDYERETECKAEDSE